MQMLQIQAMPIFNTNPISKLWMFKYPVLEWLLSSPAVRFLGAGDANRPMGGKIMTPFEDICTTNMVKLDGCMLINLDAVKTG